jgi:predicted nucleotidyltransferase
VFRWPKSGEVEAAARVWAHAVAARDATVRRIVCFGSLANGRWGVGSDLDLYIEVDSSDVPFSERTLGYDASDLPVPADLIVHTAEEAGRMRAEAKRLAQEIDEKGIVLYRRDG